MTETAKHGGGADQRASKPVRGVVQGRPDGIGVVHGDRFDTVAAVQGTTALVTDAA